LVSSELMKLQLAWLEQGLDEFESQIRLQSYLDAGLDPDLAAAAVRAESYSDEVTELRERVEQLERTVAQLIEKLEQVSSG
jgi:archaellum component FlaC